MHGSTNRVGVLGRSPDGHRWIATVTLHPHIAFSGRQPSADELADLHHRAHEGCFIANSVRSTVTIAGGADVPTGGLT